MGSPFTDTLTYSRKIGDAPDADTFIEGVEPFVVELRPLDAGDRAEIRDTMALEVDPDLGEASMQARLGTIEILTVEKALVSWTIPGTTPTRATIGRLRPDVLEAIREFVSYGTQPKPADEADEAAERQRAGLERDELREGEPAGRVPLASSGAADAGAS